MILLLTEEGIVKASGEPFLDPPFHGMKVTAGTVRTGRIALVVAYREIWEHDGASWYRLSGPPDLRTYCISYDQNGRLICGTEKARLGTATRDKFQFFKTFDEIPTRDKWNTPFGAPPAVRSIDISTDNTLYADIHVGWIARSLDDGKSWENLTEGLHKDVHQVKAHPRKSDIVFAATAGGFYLSYDKGNTWHRRNRGIGDLYARACECFPEKDIYMMSTSTGPHGIASAKISRSGNEGQEWERVSGLPGVVHSNINTFQIQAARGGKAYTAIGNTDLYESNDYGKSWRLKEKDFAQIHALLVTE